MKNLTKTRERLFREDIKDNPFLFYRHIAAYNFSTRYVEKKVVLDLGCSDGYGSLLIAKLSKKTIALDKDRDAINKAKKNTLDNLMFVVGDAANLKWTNTFDIIISFQVIEHMKDVDGYLRQIKKALVKNGMAIISTTNRALRLDEGEKPWNPYHITEYGKQDLHALLLKYFSNVTLFGLTASPDIYNLEIKRLHFRKILAQLDKFNLYKYLPRQVSDLFPRIFKRKKQNKIISLDDFWVNTINVEKSLDLIAVCIK
ncbi:MAG: class I SAM-dependent methyltransferase [Candidatus Gottesmanbacteria bacterium]